MINQLFIFILIWFGVSALSAFSSGWFSLAKLFRATKNVNKIDFWLCSGLIGYSGRISFPYNHCLFVTLTDTGFRLSIFFPFRLLHPPLFIPWKQVYSVTSQSYFSSKEAVVHIQGFSVKIRISGQPS
jgi:hypothetical protein